MLQYSNIIIIKLKIIVMYHR